MRLRIGDVVCFRGDYSPYTVEFVDQVVCRLKGIEGWIPKAGLEVIINGARRPASGVAEGTDGD